MIKKCPECDLPVNVCSALALYRRAALQIDKNNFTLAKNYAEMAEEFFQRYRQEQRQ